MNSDLEEEDCYSNCYFHHSSGNISCSKPVNVMFCLKTSKTGSSTLISLMYRFIKKHDIPIVPNLFDAYSNRITDIVVAAPLNSSMGSKYISILPEHIMFRSQPVSKYLKPDAKLLYHFVPHWHITNP